MEDFEIVELYWDRDENAIAQSELKYGKYCGTIARNILFNREDTEECVNDTWIRAWQSIPPNRPENLGAYLGKITRNLALNMYEKMNAQKRGSNQTRLCLDELSEVLGHESDVQQHLDLSVLTDTINRFLGTIDAEARKIFVRRYWYMSSVNEIAWRYHITPGKVKMSLLRTRNYLKDYLRKEGYEI
ncbi:MAG: sigma-70 family RNA polymerase sigma factor [Erysipelotrichaceae bacterium]|nr:sigma-70 family RNA polymerase sigma factor [Erysipelotrichaceae bacterium]